MIIVVCTDDDELYEAARRDAANFPEIYGEVYTVFDQNLPELGPEENLFISAHGTELGDDGNAVIGSEANDFYINAVDFWENIKDIFPDMYSGNVLVDACNSADWGGGGDIPSFASALQTQIGEVYGGAEVFGRTGEPNMLDPIPMPGDGAWVPGFDPIFE